jgi:ATP-binding cassette, subfamily G (WHITE), eye pigment precursor transporter
MAEPEPASFNFSAELEWENLTVSTIPTKKVPSRTLLKSCKGLVRPGEFLAIMGPSGAGKTTLLNCLSQKHQKSLQIDTGRILLNGRVIESLNYKAMIGFVPQDDILLESMTPRECIDFSAALTMDLTENQRSVVVTNMLDELGLSACADSLIGGTIARGISGSERKRTSIGVEIVFNPSILFLDEPTTGQDSYTALSIINLLVKLTTEKNCTVVATIHQPSSQIFSKFDRLLLLAYGTTIFTDRARYAHKFFNDVGHPIKENYNPADHFMNVLSTEQFLNEEYRNNVKSRVAHRQSTALMNATDEPRAHFQVSSLVAFLLLTKRAFREIKRNPIILKAKIMKTLINAALCCMTFANLGNSLTDMQDHFGALFMLSNVVIMEGMMATFATFQTQKPVFLREYFGRKYGVIPFFMSYSVALIPIEVIFAIGVYGISYFVMGLNERPERFFTMLLIGSFATLTGSGYALLLSVIAPTIEIASALAPVIVMPLMLSSGFMVTFKNIPNWFFLQYISPFRYSFEATSRTDVEHNPTISHATTTAAIHSLHLPEDYTESILYLLLLLVSVRVVAMFFLKVLNRKI